MAFLKVMFVLCHLGIQSQNFVFLLPSLKGMKLREKVANGAARNQHDLVLRCSSSYECLDTTIRCNTEQNSFVGV